jgi:hypothetical protein
LYNIHVQTFHSIITFDLDFCVSILNYSAEVWGYTKCQEIERIHLKFCKHILNVKLSTSNVGVYGELARFPLYINRYIRIFKFWLKILNTKNCVIRKIYDLMLEDEKVNWANNVKKLLYCYSFGYIWESPQNVDINSFITCFKPRLIDTFVQDWNSSLTNNSVLFVY